MVWQRWWVTMWCVKDGVSKMVCDKVGCERGCVKDVVWRRWCVKESWKRVYERWCVKDGVWQRCVKDCVWTRWRVTPQPAQCHKCHACQAKRRWMCPSGTPARWNQGGCHQVPRLPCKVPRRHARPSGPKRATQCHECHACHAKRPWMWDCATPATWTQGGCHQVPRLPCKVPRRHARTSWPKRATQCHECHACQAKRRWMSPSATPARWNQGGCHQVPRLPRKVPWRHARSTGPKRATQCHECHACHAKRPWMWDCATPATWNERGCHQVPRLPRKTKVACVLKQGVCNRVCVTECVTKDDWQRWCVKVGVWQSCGSKMVCDKVVCESWCVTKWCVTKLCWKMVCVTKLCVKVGVWQSCVWKLACVKVGVWQSGVWQSCVERWRWQSCVWKLVMTKLCVKVRVWQSCVSKKVWKLLVFKVGVWQSCVWKLVMTKLCVKVGVWQSGVSKKVWKLLVFKVGVWQSCVERWCVTKLCVEVGVWQSGGRGGGGGGGGGGSGYRIKNKNPTQSCGEKRCKLQHFWQVDRKKCWYLHGFCTFKKTCKARSTVNSGVLATFWPWWTQKKAGIYAFFKKMKIVTWTKPCK